MKALSSSIIKKPKKSQSPICTLKRNSSSVTVSLWLLPALPHIPLVLFSLGPAAFPGITKMLQWSQWQPRQRRSAQPRILYWQQHSFALQKIIHLTDLTVSYVSTCTQRQKITQIVLLEVFFCKGFNFCCPSALSQDIAQCFLYYKKVCIRQEEKNFLRRLMCTIVCN